MPARRPAADDVSTDQEPRQRPVGTSPKIASERQAHVLRAAHLLSRKPGTCPGTRAETARRRMVVEELMKAGLSVRTISIATDIPPTSVHRAMRAVARAEAKREIAVLKIMEVFLEKAQRGRSVARLALVPSTKAVTCHALDLMFGRDIHTMLRGLRLDRYAFPLSAIRCSQGPRFLLRVTRSTESASHSDGARGASACVCGRAWVGNEFVHELLRYNTAIESC